MTNEEVDKIIADAVADSKGKSKWHRPDKKKLTVERIRAVLNIVFMVGFVAAILIYFFLPDNRALFFSVGFGAMVLKVIEFLLRFLF